jgi:hypothetical protein
MPSSVTSCPTYTYDGDSANYYVALIQMIDEFHQTITVNLPDGTNARFALPATLDIDSEDVREGMLYCEKTSDATVGKISCFRYLQDHFTLVGGQTAVGPSSSITDNQLATDQAFSWRHKNRPKINETTSQDDTTKVFA